MSLKTNMKMRTIFFGSLKYYGSHKEIDMISDEIFRKLKKFLDEKNIEAKMDIVVDKQDIKKYGNDRLTSYVFVPLSGSIQTLMLEAAENLEDIIIYAAYVSGNGNKKSYTKTLLEKNSAPSLMDTYSVLKRKGKNVSIAKNNNELINEYFFQNGINRFKNSKLLAVGEKEPWVISASERYEILKSRFNIDVEKISLQSIYENYEKVKKEEVEKYATRYLGEAKDIKEPNSDDIYNSTKLIYTLEQLLQIKKADGLALACFKLLNDIETTGCLSLSYINDSKDHVAACEGDIDSLVTLLFVKAVSGKSGFMANPNLQNDKSINFVHCSCPMSFHDNTYNLRSHHESGIGVSPELKFEKLDKLTIVRISDDFSKIFIQRAKADEQIQEKSCRTQVKVLLEDYEGFMKNVLGCHNILVSGDYLEIFKKAAKRLGFEVVS